eukprot:scaffold11295_cov19-Tisochrysis_lutea.AAC.3
MKLEQELQPVRTQPVLCHGECCVHQGGESWTATFWSHQEDVGVARHGVYVACIREEKALPDAYQSYLPALPVVLHVDHIQPALPDVQAGDDCLPALPVVLHANHIQPALPQCNKSITACLAWPIRLNLPAFLTLHSTG